MSEKKEKVVGITPRNRKKSARMYNVASLEVFEEGGKRTKRVLRKR